MNSDRKQVAGTQDYEVYSIQNKYKIPTKYIRAAMKVAGKGGKPTTSRKMIYAKLIEMQAPGYKNLPSYKEDQGKREY